eukprot:10745354-Prorocentrum_lima.AAC.1
MPAFGERLPAADINDVAGYVMDQVGNVTCFECGSGVGMNSYGERAGQQHALVVKDSARAGGFTEKIV